MRYKFFIVSFGRILREGECHRNLHTLIKIYAMMGLSMQVSKWGNSLAIRLPATVVEALELKEGDEIEVTITGQRNFSVDRDQRKKVALERIIKRGWTLPRGFKFDREGANER
jgi:antitoxin MazE